MGGTVFHFPVLQTKEIEDKQPLDKAILSFKEYDWVIFTSAYGVQFFIKRLRELGAFKNLSDFPNVCAIGPATAAAVAESGLKTTLVAQKHAAEGVLAALENYHGGLTNLSNLRILMPRAKEAREFLPQSLSDAGSRVHVVACYQMVRPEISPEVFSDLRKKRPDLIVFTSAATINTMVDILGSQNFYKLFLETTVAVIGPITAKAAESHGKCADIVPKESTVSALLIAIHEYFANLQPEAQGTF